MKNCKMLTVVFCLAVLFFGIPAVIANAFGPPLHKGGGLGLRTLMELDLSDSQKAEVSNLIDKYRETGEQLRDQLLEAKEASMDVILAEPFDEEKVRQAFQEISPLLEEMMVLKASFMAELRQVLNPEQQELLEEKRAELSERVRDNMQLRESMIDTWLQTMTQ